MLLLTKPSHLVTLVKNFLLKPLTNSVNFHIYQYGSPVLSMIASNIKLMKIYRINLLMFLLLSELLKRLLILTIEFQ